MKLLPFQTEAVERCLGFAKVVLENKVKLESIDMPTNGVGATTWTTLYRNSRYSELVTEDDIAIPNVSVCIPTGGGKTITGVHASVRLLDLFSRDSLFIVWLVPSDAIYRQVSRDFSPGGSYYQSVLKAFGKPINLKTNSSVWIDTDLENNSAITVLLLSKDSLIRSATNRSALLLYRNPDKVSGLSVLSESPNPCLFELIKVARPIFVIDEAHKMYTEIGRDFFRSETLATFILELTATPKPYDEDNFPNIIFSASGTDLIEHNLIKNPINYAASIGLDPKTLLEQVIGQQQVLEEKFRSLNHPVVPRVLISTEFTARAQESKTYSVASIKQILQDSGVHEDEIIIKSSELNELGDRDLDSMSDPAKYILTKTALMEGWDCKSVYILVLLNRISAPITNFQIIGRGLRQPFRRYLPERSLNTLFVITNSECHDESVAKLSSFLGENGLSELTLSSQSQRTTVPKSELSLVHDPWVHYLDFNYDVYNSVAFRRKMQRQILNSIDKVLLVTQSQSDAELVRVSIDLETGSAGSNQYHTLAMGGGSLYSAAGMERFRVRLFSRLQEFFVLSSEAIAMTDLICEALKKDEPPVPSEQLLIENIVAKVEEIKTEYLNGEFSNLLSENSKVGDGLLSHFFGDSFEVTTEPDPQFVAQFSYCLLGNMPKSLFNQQELQFARFLDRSDKFSWLKATPGFEMNFPYPLGKFYPDFVISPNAKSGKPKSTFYVETKGSHLISTPDSKFKKSACEEISRMSKGRLILIFGSFSDCEDVVSEAFGMA